MFTITVFDVITNVQFLHFDTNFNCFFLMKGPVDSKQALGQIMPWCQTGVKPLREPMMFQLTCIAMLTIWILCIFMLIVHIAKIVESLISCLCLNGRPIIADGVIFSIMRLSSSNKVWTDLMHLCIVVFYADFVMLMVFTLNVKFCSTL